MDTFIRILNIISIIIAMMGICFPLLAFKKMLKRKKEHANSIYFKNIDILFLQYDFYNQSNIKKIKNTKKDNQINNILTYSTCYNKA